MEASTLDPRPSTLAIALALVASLATGLPAQSRTLAERLGHPAGAKLLVLHADDLGVAHSVDSASFDALDRGAVSSASIMVPTPWLTEVAAYARAHPRADLGLHLTLTSEWKTYRWGSVASRDSVRTLLDSTGTFPDESDAVAARANPDEVERELRAQIERALALGIRPTHLDTHMGTLTATPDLFARYAKVAHDYHLPFLTVRAPRHSASPLRDGDVVVDAVIGISPDVPPERWKEFYVDAISKLTPGLTELIVHLGHDDAELRAITVDHVPWGSAWRQRDFDVVTSPEFRKALNDNHVVLVTWKQLYEAMSHGP